MKRHIAIFALSALFISCTEEAIGLFDEQHYLHFTNESKKVSRFSFATAPGLDTYVLDVPVTLIGRSLDEDAEYSVEVVFDGDTPTTASPASFDIPEKPVFHKGIFEDKLPVRLINTEELGQEKRLVIRIVENGSFRLGPVTCRTAVIYFSNVLSRPDWWDDDMAKIYLGDYSDIKYQQFIIATGVTDLKDKSISEITAYVIEFVYYLRELDANGETVYEKDGVTKVLDNIPYAKNM
ncbi:MAG: DUF4843 domain-containing protein [Clostridium sp.]|nr:DUF4843 domain-containing protein [Bacteroides sp.]MCM1198358.1 DUF4843 domain-containing protein [Clostridium sp.]